MKTYTHTFESFLVTINEGIRLDSNEKIIDKMTINDFDSKKWELNVVEVDNELNADSPDSGKEVYITLTGKYARDTTSDSIMIPKPQWDEFKKLISKI